MSDGSPRAPMIVSLLQAIAGIMVCGMACVLIAAITTGHGYSSASDRDTRSTHDTRSTPDARSAQDARDAPDTPSADDASDTKPSVFGDAFAPQPGLRWRIQLTGAFIDAAVDVYDLDPYQTAAATVSDLRAHSRHTICHLDVGISDQTLPDAGRIPADTLGARAGPGRRWLDIRDWSALAPVLADRLRLCVRKGFDAVDADSGFGYAHRSGFGLTESDQIAFDRRVAGLAHHLGLKAAVRTTPALADMIAPVTDFGVVSGCFAGPDCDAFSVYVRTGKAVFDVETGGDDFCPMARAYGYAATRSTARLDGAAQRPC